VTMSTSEKLEPVNGAIYLKVKEHQIVQADTDTWEDNGPVSSLISMELPWPDLRIEATKQNLVLLW